MVFHASQKVDDITESCCISQVKAENRWREVTGSFIFPATATNASFMLKKYYMSLLYHFEQLYFFGAQGWYQQESGVCNLQNSVFLFWLSHFAITHSMLSLQIPEYFPALESELKHKPHRREKGAAMLLQVSFSRLIFSSRLSDKEGYVR
jgi:hypothetical protein